eukprot:4452089-Prorocentrum_lima.AAC.1
MGAAECLSSPALVDHTASIKAPLRKLVVHRVKGVCLKAIQSSPVQDVSCQTDHSTFVESEPYSFTEFSKGVLVGACGGLTILTMWKAN